MAETAAPGLRRGGAAPHGLGVRLHLALLVLLAMLPAWCLAGYTAWRSAEAERGRLVDAAQDAARDIAMAVDREAAALRASLTALATSPALATGDRAAFARQAALLRASQGLRIALDAAGPGGAPARAGGPAVPGLERDPANGDPVVAFRQPVAADGGAAEGVALTLTTDPIALWSGVLRRAHLPPGWVASVLDGADTILARQPEPERFVGQPVHPDALAVLRAAGRGAAGGWATGSTRDGEPVHIAWRRVAGLPWTVLVGVPRDAVDGALRRAMLPVALVGLPLLAALTLGTALWGSRRLARPLRALEAAAGAAGEGAVPALLAPSGVREIDAAGRALVAAAAGRRDREAERTALAARLEAVLESTTDCVLVVDRAWRLTYLNGRARDLLAGGREVSGHGLWEGIPAAAGGALEAALRRAGEGGIPVSATASLGGPDGPWFVADAFPTPEGLTVFLRDVTAATRAERAVREGEARLQAVLDHVPVGVLLAQAPSGRIVLANRRAAAMLGVPAVGAGDLGDYARYAAFDEAGRPVAPGDRPIARALAGEEQIRAEYRFRRGDDGQMVWIRTQAAPIRDAGGRITGAVAALADIDAERRQAEALRESELRFRTLAEAVPQIVWSSGPDGAVDYVNPRFFEFTGTPPGRGLGAAPLPIHPEDRDAARAAWRSALGRGDLFEAEYRLRRADGAWRWFVARGVPARGADGAVRRWIGTANDVTELVETRQALERQVAAEAAARQAAVAAAEALAASEARFRGFAEASPDVLWILDPVGDRLEYLSPARELLWGEAVAAGDGPGLGALLAGLHPEDGPRVEAALARLRQGEPVDLEYRVRRGDAQLRWVRLLSFPMRDRAGRVGRVGGFARDITARREADERQRMLIGELNHRVKNTLATVLSLARQTARRADRGGAEGEAPRPPPPAADPFLADFQARLMALARGHDLLTASTWRGAMLQEVAAAALSPWRGGDPAQAPAAAAAGRIGLGGPPVWLGPRQALGLALAIHEMATNAAKHGALGAPGGQVELAWRRAEDGRVELAWTETGGPPVRPPERRGFGTRLLRSGLASELGPGSEVTLDYPPEGFRAKMRFRPLLEGEATWRG